MYVFNLGDVVTLKSGGPKMTVSWIFANEVTCLWSIASGEIASRAFPPVALVLIKDSENQVIKNENINSEKRKMEVLMEAPEWQPKDDEDERAKKYTVEMYSISGSEKRPILLMKWREINLLTARIRSIYVQKSITDGTADYGVIRFDGGSYIFKSIADLNGVIYGDLPNPKKKD